MIPTELPLPEPASPSAQVLASIINAQSEMTAALPDSDAIMRLVARYAMALSGATGASVSVRDGDELTLAVSEGFTAQWERARFPLAATLAGQCLLTGEPFFVPDVDLGAPEASEIARASQVRTFLAVPLLHGEHTVAALSVVAPQPYAFGQDEILVVQLLVKMAGGILGHAQAFHDLRAALEDAKRARTEAAEFAGMIAHELGSPIAAIQHASELLGLGAIDPNQARAREQIAMEAGALWMLVGDLRAAAALERESLDLHQRAVALDTLLAEAGEFAHTVAGDHPVQMQAGTGLRVLVDPGRVGQVLRYLLTNAARYTPPGTPIEIRTWRDGDRVWIAGVDQGPGIPPEDMELIFARFGRAHHEEDARAPGLGLGLYLARRIVEAHGGEFDITSIPGEGASFAFSVPAAP